MHTPRTSSPRHRVSALVALLLLMATLVVLLVGCSAIPEAMTAPADGGAFVSASVVRVVDGDTAVFLLADGTEEKTRFIGVDTPESTNSIEAYGKEAAAYTSAALAPGTSVLLERDVEERDRYGRLLAYVWLEQPSAITDAEIRAKMFNARLALDGYAQQMTIQPNSRYADYFTTYVREAREAEKGLWGALPAESRDAEPGAAVPADAAFIGNRNTRVFHRPECSSVTKMNPKNRVSLSSKGEAASAGFRPCQRCSP